MQTKEFTWTRKLLLLVKKALDAEFKPSNYDVYVNLPVTSETIRLDEAMVESHLKFDYDKIDTIYVLRNKLILFLYETGALNLDEEIREVNPVIALDIDGVLADIQTELHKLHLEWDGTTYEVSGADYDDFNYLGLAVKDRPNFKVKYLITARPNEYLEDTKTWLEFNNIDYEYIIFAQNKLAAMESFGIDILVEDNPATFEQVNASESKVCFLYDCTYNRHIETQLRIKNLAHLEQITNVH